MAHLRQLLHAYTSRRSPWGPAWWIYGVTFGAANLIRQAIVIATGAELPPEVGLAAWLATAVVVITVINTLAVILQRRITPPGPTHALDPVWPLRRRDAHDRHAAGSPSRRDAGHDQAGPPGRSVDPARRPDTMPSTSARLQPRSPSRWPPWWLSIVVIVGANNLRRAVGADGNSPAVRVVIALAFSAVVFIALTVAYRGAVRRTGRHRGGRDASP